jgi:hypothetical protein
MAKQTKISKIEKKAVKKTEKKAAKKSKKSAKVDRSNIPPNSSFSS